MADNHPEDCPEWRCARCPETDPNKRRFKSERGSPRPTNLCRSCSNKASRASRAKRPDYYRQKSREWWALSKYGLTPEQLEALGTACHLCGEPGNHIDHCHETGKVRGLLCAHCNRALGGFRDDPALLRRAADYVEAHREAPVS